MYILWFWITRINREKITIILVYILWNSYILWLTITPFVWFRVPLVYKQSLMLHFIIMFMAFWCIAPSNSTSVMFYKNVTPTQNEWKIDIRQFLGNCVNRSAPNQEKTCFTKNIWFHIEHHQIILRNYGRFIENFKRMQPASLLTVFFLFKKMSTFWLKGMKSSK